VTAFIIAATMRMAVADEGITILKNSDFESIQDAGFSSDGLVAGIGGQTLLQRSASEHRQQFSGFYQPSGERYLHSALALSAKGGRVVGIDDVAMETLTLPELSISAPALLFQNDAAQMSLSASGLLTHLVNRTSGKDYAATNPARPVFTAQRAGRQVPASLLVQKDDVLTAQFLDPDIKVSLRITPGKHHFNLEVLSIEPADLDALYIEFPVRRLRTVALPFNATYDHEFGASFFGATANTLCSPIALSNSIQSLRCGSYRNHGIAGAKFSLVATPFADFRSAIMEAECASGLLCPKRGTPWGRDSASVRKSYLFALDVSEANIDKLINYAKLSGFGTILFLKDNWLKTHGHYQINTDNFPHGLDGVKAAVAKIHAAGLEAGAHVYPSISPNDAYITPKPDDRLATVPAPPLAEALDEKTTTLTLTAVPKLPPNGPSSKAFPGSYLRIGDEIIRCEQSEPGTPFRYTRCIRGALGTQATAHPAGSTVGGLLALWGFFLVDPDSTLADELTQNFADVFNYADFDMVYFDGSDSIHDAYIDRWYYLNRIHLGYYQKFKKNVLYQTSTGTGTNLLWHIVPRSASADGQGDIKAYLDQRWPSILRMEANFTRPDIGWYYWSKAVRPDQFEYVAAKAMGVGGSISVSLKTSQAALESQAQSRQVMDTLHKWEQCRRADPFSPAVKAKLREPQKDFKLFSDAKGGWQLYRAAYETPKVVDILDGQQNTWILRNDLATEVELGVEIVSGGKPVAPDSAQASQTLFPAAPLGQPIITVNGKATTFPVSMASGQVLTSEGPGGVLLWLGGIAPSQKVIVSTKLLRLKPGENAITFSTTTPDAFPGGIRVLLYRIWPMEND